MSDGFFASKYINGVELTEVHRRHPSGEAAVLSVLLEPTNALSSHPWLGGLQAVPSVSGDLRPLTTFNPSVNGWNLVDKALRSMITDVASQRRQKQSLFQDG